MVPYETTVLRSRGLGAPWFICCRADDYSGTEKYEIPHHFMSATVRPAGMKGNTCSA